MERILKLERSKPPTGQRLLTEREFEEAFERWSNGITLFQARASRDWVKAATVAAGEVADMRNRQIADLLNVSVRNLQFYKREFRDSVNEKPRATWIDLAVRMIKEI